MTDYHKVSLIQEFRGGAAAWAVCLAIADVSQGVITSDGIVRHHIPALTIALSMYLVIMAVGENDPVIGSIFGAIRTKLLNYLPIFNIYLGGLIATLALCWCIMKHLAVSGFS